MNIQEFIESNDLEKIKTLILNKTFNINDYGAYGFTILHHAVLYNNVEKVKLVIELGASLEAISMFGTRPFHLLNTTIEILQILINAGVDIYSKNWSGLNRMEILLGSWDQWEIKTYTPPPVYDIYRNDNAIRTSYENMNNITKNKLKEFNFLSPFYKHQYHL